MTSKIEQTIPQKLEEVLANHYKEIELLTFQYGVKPEQMGRMMEGILSASIQKLKEDPNSLTSRKDWFEMALTVLDSTSIDGVLIDQSDELIDTRGKNVFLFEEDEALHRLIGSLEENLKVPLILHYFHGKREEEISSLLGLSVNEILDKLKQAESILIEYMEIETISLLVKRLGLLKKSYDRIRNLTDIDEIMVAIRGTGADPLTPEHEQEVSNKFSIWKPVLLISIIMVFFSSIIFVSESYGKVNDRFLAKIEKDYEKAKEEKIETLQINKEIFSQLWFVQQADEQFATKMVRLRRQLEKGENLQREEIKKELEGMIESFALPSEMVEEVIRNPIKEDELKSDDFFQRYMQRLEEIKYAYHQTVFDPNTWQGQQTERPEIPENLRKALQKQNLVYQDEESDFFPSYLINNVTEKMKESVHPSSHPYLLILEKSNFPYYMRNYVDTEEVLSTLRQFEKAFMETERSSNLYQHLSGIFAGTVMWLVDDSWRSPEEKMFDYQGMFKENYRELYQALADSGNNSPLSALFQPIVKELEASDWQFSQKQRYFDYQFVNDAITLAREGRLDEFSYESTTIYQEIPMDYSEKEVFLDNNGSYLTYLERSYDEFKGYPEPSNMGGNDPLYFLGLYEMARAEGNVRAVYNLTFNTMSFNEFEKQWKAGKSLFEGVDSIRFDKSLVEENPGKQRKEYPVVFMVDGKEEIRAKMVFINYYWLVSEVMN